MTMQRMFIFVFVLLGMVLAGNSSKGDRGKITELGSTETWILKGYAVGKNAGNESGGVSMADVILLDNGNYRMYYDQMSFIKYAESSDGVSWTIKGTVLQGSSDPSDREYSVKGPSVLKLPDGRYRMYYQSGPQNQPMEEPKYHVRSAISQDGVNFTIEGVRIEISSVDSSSPLKLAGHGTYFIASDGTYVGIFSGNFKDEMGPSELVMATSSDGLTFGNFRMLYEDWHDPIVIKVSSGYRMYATYLLEEQGTALSSDGLTWPSQMTQVSFVDSSGNILTEGEQGVGDFGGVLQPSGTVRLFSNYGNPSENIAYYDPLDNQTPTPTPTPCEDATAIEADPTELTLQKKESDTVIVTVIGENDCPVEGDMIKAKTDKAGRGRIRVTPSSKRTDASGEAIFTITAKNKTGNATVTFKDGSLSTQVSVTVVK
ncbi:MAG: hypothetical protein HY607_00250 [Planctomycetes bacterium]|nr:hypothetical protein [Planctomycetota bacterium]